MNIKNYPHYLFNDNMIVNIKDFDWSLLEINKFSLRGVFSLNIYHTKYIPTKSLKHGRINHDKDFLYLSLDDVDTHIEENDGIKYLILTPTDKNKGVLKNYKKLWEETKRQIEVINHDEPIEYKKDFMKLKFESDDHLPLGKTFNILDIIIVATSVFEKMVSFIHNFFT